MDHQNSMQEQLQCLTMTVTKMHEEMKEVRTDIASIKQSTDSINDSFTNALLRMDKLETRVIDTESELQDLRNKYAAIQEQVINLETYNRRDNLLIDGLTEPQNETNSDCLKTVVDFFVNKLGLKDAATIRVIRCHRLGPRTGTRPRSIIVRFHWFGDRTMVWESRQKLKGTNLFLNEDFPKEINERRKTLLPLMKAARQNGHRANLNVDKMHINFTNGGHRVYTVDNLNTLPKGLHPHDISTKQTNECLAFFTKLCPLSNFYQCPVLIDGHRYHSVEQYYQYSKALFAKDEASAHKILTSNSPAQCKFVGDRVNVNKDDWLSKCLVSMETALYHKFSQNPGPRKFLLETGERVLVEASKDKFWGSGITLGSPKVTTISDWPGENRLGQLLIELRKRLR